MEVRVNPGEDEAVTVRLMVVLALALPELPITVTFAVPGVALLFAVKVRMLVVAALAGLNDAVTPLGSEPETEKATFPEKPLAGRIVNVVWPLPPCCTVTCDPESVNVGDGVWFADDTPLQPLMIKDNESPAANATRDRHDVENIKRPAESRLLCQVEDAI